MKHRLEDIDKKVDYKVPEGYFEQLPLKIQQRIDAEKKEVKVFQLPSWSYAMAASVVLVLTLVFLFQDGSPNAETLLAEVSEEALIAYLDEIELDEYDIASALPAMEDIQFENIDMLNDLDLENESFDNILLEYNLEEESLEI